MKRKEESCASEPASAAQSSCFTTNYNTSTEAVHTFLDVRQTDFSAVDWRVTSCRELAHELLDAGFLPTICRGKHPLGTGWHDDPTGFGDTWEGKAWTTEEIDDAFDRFGDLNVGNRWNPATGIDIEGDSPESERDRSALLKGSDPPVTCMFKSRRGNHHIHLPHPALILLGEAASIRWRSLQVFIGIGKGAHTLLPPSTTDGFTRYWPPGLDPGECPPQPLPEVAVKRLLEAKGVYGNGHKKPKPAEYWVKLICEGRTVGGRHPGICELAGHLLARDVHPLIVEEILVLWNFRRNSPSRNEEHVRKTVRDIVERELRQREKRRRNQDEFAPARVCRRIGHVAGLRNSIARRVRKPHVVAEVEL